MRSKLAGTEFVELLLELYSSFYLMQQLFAALYLEVIGESQRYYMRALRRAKGGEEGVRALVCSYSRWVSKNGELAGAERPPRRSGTRVSRLQPPGHRFADCA